MLAALYGSPSPPFRAAQQGLGVLLGVQPELRPNKYFVPKDDTDRNLDFILVLGLRIKSAEIASTYRKLGRPVLVQDAGWYPGNKSFHRIGINDLNWIPSCECPNDRAEKAGLITDFIPEIDSREILILGQMRGDVGHGIAIDEWLNSTALKLRTRTPHVIAFRPHPNDQKIEVRHVDRVTQVSQRIEDAKHTLKDAISRACAVVTYNSSSALEAVRLGIPVIAHRSSIYCRAGIAIDIDQPFDPEFERPDEAQSQAFLNRVGYAQWSLEELKTAEPFEFLLAQPEFIVTRSRLAIQSANAT